MKSQQLTFLLLTLLVGCAKPNYQDIPQTTKLHSFSQTPMNVDLVWEKFPNDKEMGSFILTFSSNKDSSPVTAPDGLAVVLWMPSMGHGSSPVKLETLPSGEVRVSRVFFVMSGDWEIRIQIKNQGAVVDQVIESVKY